ncbi:neuromedin-U receptor 2-like [Patiria miniata]|uniref:G-protein coupled receptors family 1 profile domain-containing protein n=1 Tax=Patiria miniata TaxID=46514 RepID=A0A914AR53_PATMI|nr:neuromedin-U receptor 2-like [Patiria miniata]
MNHTSNEESSGCVWVCQIIMVEGVVGFLGNLLVCLVILRVKFLHNMTNYLLVNLAVADMLVCVQAFFFYLSADQDFPLIRFVPASLIGKELLCRLLASAFLYWFFASVSAYTLCLVTFERYVSIVHPLQYPRKLTATRMTILIVLTWAISLLFSVPILFTNKGSRDPNKVCSSTERPHDARITHVLSFLVGYLLPITLMSLAYYKMQLTLKRQASALKMEHARAAAYDLVIARQRLVSMLTIVLGALIVLLTPGHVESLICLHPSQTDPMWSICNSPNYSYLRGACNILLYLNSVVNPIIYEFKYKKFRQGLKVAFHSCFGQQCKNSVDIVMNPTSHNR